jgi:hypothetical protein
VHTSPPISNSDPSPACRVLAVFDAAISWSNVNSPKGCSAINARAEIGDGHDGHPVFPEVSRQKLWLVGLFADLCHEASIPDPERTARTLMLLYEGAIVTMGMETFPHPFELARDTARALLTPA